ncbi:MAG: tetratricopeptide repeat protein [Pseudomonadota bacterium]
MKALLLAPLTGLALLGACTDDTVTTKADPLAKNVIDDAGLSALLLTAGDPEDAVAYFSRSLAEEPERADFRRNLALSLVRAKRLPEAVRIYDEMEQLGQSTPPDRLDHAFAALQLERWEEAQRLDASLPVAFNTARRHLLSALLADHRSDWQVADAAYARAETLTTNPARILNNWGVSHQARGDLNGATRMFERAISFDSRMFSAKNNLAMTRGLQGNYRLPIVPLTDEEQATILYNLGLIALRKQRLGIAKGLFARAVEIHPRFYPAASDRLAALEARVGG